MVLLHFFFLVAFCTNVNHRSLQCYTILLLLIYSRIVSTTRAARWPQTELPIAITPSAVVEVMVVEAVVQATPAIPLASPHFIASPLLRSVEETIHRSPAWTITPAVMVMVGTEASLCGWFEWQKQDTCRS